MKKRRRRLLFFVMVCAVMVIGYTFIKSGDSAIIPPKQAPSEEEAEVSGGEVQGELGSGTEDVTPSEEPDEGDTGGNADQPSNGGEADGQEPDQAQTDKPSNGGSAEVGEDGLAVIAEPANIGVLVNKRNKLPEDYNPTDLVYPDVRFIFSEKIEKRKLRKEAASALEELFGAAEKDNILLAGVSAYRSHSTQKTLFERYVKRDGLVKARTYSAYPGTSEHETGLAIDISGSDGKCAAADCFADTDEAAWLAEHAHEYGFIIRYPKGKEDITGYQYEPWHIRYVGVDVAAELEESGETLEEYYDAVPVTQ
ncbi:M15 family metallopeptidase [Paenibacillus harenae]|uniref:M15 family metallopeptidase n=1 Tax=Paenibacillus harenae TaxID=306543 RepID=UPI00041EDF32|nr:M15 family metallopeptidase [Paenibacillus harenae]